MTTELAKQLRLEEGVKEAAYADQFGYLTIGVGRLIDKRKEGKLSSSEIDFLLNNDLISIYADVTQTYPWAKNLSQPRFDALAQMRFQLGKAGLAAFVNTLKAMQAGNWQSVANGIRSSLWHQQTTARAERIAIQFLTDTYQYKP